MTLMLALFTGPLWVEVPVLRPEILATIANDPLRHAARDLGSPHENTHQVNSQVRNQYTRRNASYVLYSRAAVLPEPKVTLSDVAAAVPHDQRGSGYKLYLVQQARYWDDRPLYVLDELAAYTNGLAAAVERGRDIAWQLQKTREFLDYARVLLGVVRERDPNYDADALETVIRWQEFRLAAAEAKALSKPKRKLLGKRR